MKLVLKKDLSIINYSANSTELLFKVHMTENFFVRLSGRAFKVMKNGIYFILIAFLVVRY